MPESPSAIGKTSTCPNAKGVANARIAAVSFRPQKSGTAITFGLFVRDKKGVLRGVPNEARLGDGGEPEKMRHDRTVIFLGVLLVFMQLPRASADPEDCQIAINDYHSAINEVGDALQSYARCLSDSRGTDDCSLEFSTLSSDQDDFETAVSEYQGDCD